VSKIDEDPPRSTMKEHQPLIEVVADAAAVGDADADEEVSVISARVPQQLDLGLPMISVQIASPVVLSPSEKEEGVLCSAMEKYTNAWTGNFDVADDSQPIDSVDDAEKFDVSGRVVDMGDADDRPLSPTDYTLEDESDMIQSDYAFRPILQLDCRAPSPSEFSLLTESAEENDLQRLTHAAVPDDLFAIPDPSPSSAEMNIYLAMHDQFACSHRLDSANDCAVVPGTNVQRMTAC